MKRRIIAIGLSIAIIIAAILIVKALSSGKKKAGDNNAKVKATLIQVVKPAIEDVSYELEATGKLIASERLQIFSQVEGQLLNSANLFRPGKTYRKGETMLQVDVEEFRMTLLAQKSDFITSITSILPDLKSDYPNSYNAWKEYVLNLDLQKPLADLPKSETTQEKFFLAGKGILTSYYSIQSAQEKLNKYTITAPYSGIVTESTAEAGKAVRSGTELGVFINPNKFELEITLPLSSMDEVKVGTVATIHSSEIKGNWQGKVIRIGGDIDEQSQSVIVYIGVSGEHLKEGMFLTASISMSPFENAMSVQRKMLSDDNKIFVMEDGVLRHKQVEVLMKQGDKAIIKGLSADAQIMKTVIKSAYEGMPVRIN